MTHITQTLTAAQESELVAQGWVAPAPVPVPVPAPAPVPTASPALLPGCTFYTDFTDPTLFGAPHVFASGMDPALLSRVVQVPGGGCQINWPAGSANGGMAWITSLNPAWTTQTQGIGTTPYWFQFEYQVPASRLARGVDGGGGFKMFILGGYVPGANWTNSASDINNEFVVTNSGYHGFPVAYVHGMGSSGGWDGTYNNFSTPFVSQYSSVDFLVQNAINRTGAVDQAHQYCLYSQTKGASPPTVLNPGAFAFVPDERLLVKCRVHYGTYGVGSGPSNEVDVWCKRPGDAAWTNVVSARGFPVPVDGTYPGGPNGLWLTSYDTGAGVYSADTYARYYNLWIGTQDPSPTGTTLPPLTVTPPPVTTSAIAEVPVGTAMPAPGADVVVPFTTGDAFWASLPVGEVVTVAGTALTAQLTMPAGFVDFGQTGISAVMSAWSGAAFDPNGILHCAGGAHLDSSNNGVFGFNLETMKWSMTMPPSIITATDVANAKAAWNATPNAWWSYSQGINAAGGADDVWPDGKPTALHNFNDIVFGNGGIFRGGMSHIWRVDAATGAPSKSLETIGYKPGTLSAWDPVNNVMVRCGSLAYDYWDIRTYDPVAGVSTIRPHLNLSPGNVYDWNGYDSGDLVGRELVCFDGTRALAINLDTWAQRIIPVAAPFSTDTQIAGHAWVADLGRYAVPLVSGGVGTLDPATGHTALWTINGRMTPAITPQNGNFGRFRYYAKRKTLVLIPDTGMNVRLLRMA